MNDGHEHHDDVSGHLYIPKDERAGGQSDTEGHMPRARFVGPADEGDLVDDLEGDEDDVIDDVEGHRVAPSDPINEPPAVRGRDGRGHR